MTDRQYRWVLAVVVTAVIAFLAVAMTFAARSEPLTPTPGKYYVVVTIFEPSTKRIYTKLIYNPAGEFASKEACEAWKPDEVFIGAFAKLIADAQEAFGPTTAAAPTCATPTPPGEHV